MTKEEGVVDDEGARRVRRKERGEEGGWFLRVGGRVERKRETPMKGLPMKREEGDRSLTFKSCSIFVKVGIVLLGLKARSPQVYLLCFGK